MKILAMYLPQFHETPYNNKWWGEGYTDWVAAKNARNYMNKQKLPRVPLDNNYYDLSDPSGKTLDWQAKLAKKYGIDGFCIYHYWFAGQQFLDTPCKILLEHKEIDIEFSFCWDCGSWKRTWTAVPGNNEQEILVEQVFGDEEMWTKHFNDLLPYFKDSRYIKKDNKPVFHIYNVSLIPCLEQMRAHWDNLAKEKGFDGIYLIAGNISKDYPENCQYADALYNFEPNTTRIKGLGARNLYLLFVEFKTALAKRLTWFPGLYTTINSKIIYKLMCSREDSYLDKPVYLGLYPNHDETPRRGKKGVIYYGETPELFEKTLKTQLERARAREHDFLYINAWNEWGETCYLEPDEENGCAYLESVKRGRMH